MKTIFKSLIKWLFVIILPTIVVCVTINYFYTFGWNGWPMTLLFSTVVLITLLNAVFYLTSFRNTNLLPKISPQFLPVFGFAIAYDRIDKWIVILPFCSIEFKRKDKTEL